MRILNDDERRAFVDMDVELVKNDGITCYFKS